MRYIVAQTVLDLLGDLLSKSHQIQRQRGNVADTDSSFVYPSQAHLGHPDQVASKSCPCLFLMSYFVHGLGYDYPDLGQP